MSQIRKRGRLDHRSFVIVGLLTMSLTAIAGVSAAQTDNLRRFDLRVENGRLTENIKVITVKHHDRIEINWRADRRTILHLHGYDIETAVGPDKPETTTFIARATGRFAIEIHAPRGEEKAGRHMVLIYLEVHPR